MWTGYGCVHMPMHLLAHASACPCICLHVRGAVPSNVGAHIPDAVNSVCAAAALESHLLKCICCYCHGYHPVTVSARSALPLYDCTECNHLPGSLSSSAVAMLEGLHHYKGWWWRGGGNQQKKSNRSKITPDSWYLTTLL